MSVKLHASYECELFSSEENKRLAENARGELRIATRCIY